MTPDPRDMPTGTEVTFDLPADTDVDTTLLRDGRCGLHGDLMAAGPKYAYVFWRGQSREVHTDTIERADTRGDHPGDIYDGATNIHSE